MVESILGKEFHMKKRRLVVMLVFTLIISLIIAPAYGAKPSNDRIVDTVEGSDTSASLKVADLVTEENVVVGDVFIMHVDENNYEVRYLVTESGWYLTEVHFEAISEGDLDYISNKGTLIPGKFTEKTSFALSEEITEYSFLYKAGAEVTDFAAHAVVGQHAVTHMESEYQLIVSDGETEYYDEIDWAPAVATWVHPSWTNNVDLNPAIWIWKGDISYPGDEVVFKRDFDVTGTPTFAKLYITTDNEYDFNINDGVVRSDSTWTNVEEYDVLGDVEEGSNRLNVTAVNYAGGSSTSNPGGLIYKLEIESEWEVIDIPEIYESAWGRGVDAETSNWSMKISLADLYHWKEIGTVDVEADKQDSTDTGIPLETGKMYKLQVSGTADAGAGIEFDAKYSSTYGDPWTDLVTGYEVYEFQLLELYVNGSTVDWGLFDSSHEYEHELIGDGNVLELWIYDIHYPSNNGKFTIKVYEWSL